jgi:heme A synthase
VETGLVVMLLAVYAWLAPRTKTPPNVIIASAILVLWLQIAFG